MDLNLTDKNKYPIRVVARRIHLNLRQEFPCILFFDSHIDEESFKIDYTISVISRKYPKVCCYKVGWESHKNYYQKINPSQKYDVTVWKSENKLRVVSKPSIEQVQEIFEYVQREIDGPCKQMYLYYLYQQNKNYKERNKRKFERIQNQLDRYKNQINDYPSHNEKKLKQYPIIEKQSMSSLPFQNNSDPIFLKNCLQNTHPKVTDSLYRQDNLYPHSSKTNYILSNPSSFSKISLPFKKRIHYLIKRSNFKNIEAKNISTNIKEQTSVLPLAYNNELLFNPKNRSYSSLNKTKCVNVICSKINDQNSKSGEMLKNSKNICENSPFLFRGVVNTIQTVRSKRKQYRPVKIVRCSSESSLK